MSQGEDCHEPFLMKTSVSVGPNGGAGGPLRRLVSCELWKLLTAILLLLVLAGDVHTWWETSHARRRWMADPAVGKDVPAVLGRSVKTLLEDPFMVYVLSPAASVLERVTGLAGHLPWLTANMVSFTHFWLGLLAAWLVSSPSLGVRRLAVLLYLVRTVLDNYDGIVAGVRNKEARDRGEPAAEGFYSLGYYLDGFSDMFSAIGFMLGVMWHLWHRLPTDVERSVRKRQDVLPVWVPCQTRFSPFLPSPPHLMVMLTVVNFTVQCGIVSVCWNPWVIQYTRALGQSTSTNQLQLQFDALCWMSTQLTLWAWRFQTLLFMTMTGALYCIFIDRLWEYMRAVRCWGYVIVVVVEIVTLIQVHHVKSFIASTT